MIAVNINTTSGTETTCIFNAGSHAIGCLINLTNIANANTYCVAYPRFSNASLIVLPLCQSHNITIDAGRYWLHVYDIDGEGVIPTLPAVIDEIVLVSTSGTILLSTSGTVLLSTSGTILLSTSGTILQSTSGTIVQSTSGTILLSTSGTTVSELSATCNSYIIIDT